ncbi:twin-arginine translocase subunit TatC [uncultured Corynebacterium sp.]|uniref:twin-arginine translocase subunit TatC n=1 Tax=uncultured Corynebacterium sp. TaxID=159447 RepID=UPI0025E418EB|nr:twin-arginine translocase subunit TatC [uncultured Corynebacterium sp.]
MTIVEHINELRKRVFIALVAIFIGTIIGYIWYNVEVGPIPSLGEVLRGPYCNLPPEARFGSEAGQCRLLATGPFEMFMLRLKVGALAGMVFSSPIWLGQIWAYITPGLHKNEKRWTLGVGISAGLLFTVGAVLAYFVLSYGLEFLLTIGDEAQIAALNGERYFSFAMALLLIFGVSFEVPLITVLLNLANVVSYQQLKDKRRFIWAFLFLFAAFVTPGQDPISMVILAISLCTMMEIATQIARLNDRRRKNNQEEWLELDDEEGSDIAAPQPIKPVTATAAPQSTSAARPINEPKRQDPKAQTFTNSNFDDIL